MASVDGEVHGSGDHDVRFSLQSISKVFTLPLVLSRDDAAIWRRVHREPSGSAFNSLFQLEFERGIPRNPFINAGALVVADQLLADTGDGFGAAASLPSSPPAAPSPPGDRAWMNMATR